jgi:hypothetical protein
MSSFSWAENGVQSDIAALICKSVDWKFSDCCLSWKIHWFDEEETGSVEEQTVKNNRTINVLTSTQSFSRR